MTSYRRRARKGRRDSVRNHAGWRFEELVPATAFLLLRCAVCVFCGLGKLKDFGVVLEAGIFADGIEPALFAAGGSGPDDGVAHGFNKDGDGQERADPE